jgi:peptidoglycan/xylan/chitin deacetylase (PgdA/CDA1 family)
VLVYHRVRQRGLDPWNLTIDPEIFAGQMETLARDWSPTSLAELVDGFGRRRLPERSVAVTFDDGYADNLEVAAPILLEHGIPTTLFVAAELIDAGRARGAAPRSCAAAGDVDALERQWQSVVDSIGCRR